MPEGSPKHSQATSKTAPSQQLFFQIILSNMKNKPDINWAVVAEKAGYKSGNIARDRYNQIMKKLSGESGTNTLKKSPSKGHSGGTESQGRPSNISFPSKVTKSKPVQRKKRIAKWERDSESRSENEQRFGEGDDAYGFGAEMM